MGGATRNKATVLKILNGSAANTPSRTKNDAAVKARGMPTRLDWIDLDADERRIFEWYMDCGILPAVHAKEDTTQLYALARVTVQRDRAFADVKEKGRIIKHPVSGREQMHPNFVVWMALSDQVRKMLNELALSPMGRLRHAPPLNGAPLQEATSWDDIEDA